MDKNSPISKKFATQKTIKSFYIEGKFLNDEQKNIIGIGIKTKMKTVIYQWNQGVIFSPDGLIRCKEQCRGGDVIDCRMTLDVKMKGNNPLHNVVFYRNRLAGFYIISAYNIIVIIFNLFTV